MGQFSGINLASQDHNSLANLAVGDVHTQYALLAGRATPQAFAFGTASGASTGYLTSTFHSTKGKYFLNSAGTITVDELNTRLGIGTASPSYALDIGGAGVIGSITFTGSGLNDMSIQGTYAGIENGTLRVRVINNDYPPYYYYDDSLQWSLDDGASWSQGSYIYTMTGGWQTLANTGIQVKFNAVRGHTPGDYWTVPLTASLGIVNTDNTYKIGGNTIISDIYTNYGIGWGVFSGNNIIHATYNVGIGKDILTTLSTGVYNFGAGISALKVLTAGEYNIAIGYESAKALTTGGINIAIGYQALSKATTAGNNIAIGYQCMNSMISSGFNIGIGFWTLRETTGEGNTAIGYSSLYLTTTGYRNVGIGWLSGGGLTTGNSNTFIGYTAGNGAGQKVDAVNSMALGSGVVTTASNQYVYGNSSVTQHLFTAGNLQLGEAGNFVFGTTTGTKIGTATTQKIGFFNATPIVQPSAYTQTYSTASKTHPAITAANLATTASTQTTPWGFASQAQADDIATQINKMQTDLVNLKKVANSIIDDLQALGLAS